MNSMIATVFAVLAAPACALAGELQASPWTDFREASVRLLLEKPEAGSTRLKGALEIRLMDGFKTYWRNAGDSGVPPSFDFSKTAWLGAVDIAFPLPGRFDDGAGGTAFGYVGAAILPFEGQRVGALNGPLILKLDFAVCGTMCIPLSGELMADQRRLAPAGSIAQAALAEARRRVPVPLDAAMARGKITLARDHGAARARWLLTFALPMELAGFEVYPEGKTFLITEKSKILPDGSLRVVLTGDPPPGGDGRFGMARITFGDRRSAHEVTVDLDTATVAP
jgi:DsbC/DsbD-like thiol-disulfide interchange protein